MVLSGSSGKFFGRSDGSHRLKFNKILTTSVYSSLIGAVTELLKTLHQDQDYHCVHRYAAKALAIVPHSADIYYWLIHAIHKQGHTEIARSELRTAKHRLLDEDYAMLENRLAVEANMT